MNKTPSKGGIPMRLSNALIVAGALLVAAPAIAQDNAAAPANTIATNAGANTAMAAPETTNAAVPAAPAPTETTTTAQTNTMTTVPARKSFPWGVLGLLGLIGLFGVRKVKG
jgi:hypothetical protein